MATVQKAKTRSARPARPWAWSRVKSGPAMSPPAMFPAMPRTTGTAGSQRSLYTRWITQGAPTVIATRMGSPMSRAVRVAPRTASKSTGSCRSKRA